MALTQETTNHWNYFIALEDDLAKISRYIEFSEDNYKTYSIELAHLLLATASEIDVILKSLCNAKAPDDEHKSINQYRETIRAKNQYLIQEYCTMPRFGLKFNPWAVWQGKEDTVPEWWTAYNKVKHHRDSHFKQANLENVLNAMSALALVNIYLQKHYTRYPRNSLGHMARVVVDLSPETSLIQFNRDYYSLVAASA